VEVGEFAEGEMKLLGGIKTVIGRVMIDNFNNLYVE
jgi:hypothetical protein